MLQELNPEVAQKPKREIGLREYADGTFIAYDKASGHDLTPIRSIEIEQHVDDVTTFTVTFITVGPIDHADVPHYKLTNLAKET